MAGSDPIDGTLAALSNTSNVPKNFVRSELLKLPREFTAAEVATYNLTGRSIIYVTDLQGFFQKDTSDTTTAVSDSFLRDINGLGFRVIATLGSRVVIAAHKNNVTQDISSGVSTFVTFGTASANEGSAYDAATGRITGPVGYYDVDVALHFTAGIVDGATCTIGLTLNGNGIDHVDLVFNGTAAQTMKARFAKVYRASTSEYLQVYVQAFGAGTKTINGNPLLTNLRAAKVDGQRGEDGNGREVLTADRTYYVRSDGSDFNTGLANTSGGAFLTLQKAVDVAASIDLSIYNVTIQVGASAAWAGVTFKNYVGAGTITVIGDETTPANCTVTSVGFVAARCGGVYNVRGFKLVGCGLVSTSGSYIGHQNIEFGAFAGGAHMFTQLAGIIAATGNYTVSGSSAWHWRATIGGRIVVQSTTVTITGTPAFSQAFAEANQASIIRCNGNTFSGSATGKRYNSTGNSAISSSGATLPGNVAGTTTADEEYA